MAWRTRQQPWKAICRYREPARGSKSRASRVRSAAAEIEWRCSSEQVSEVTRMSGEVIHMKLTARSAPSGGIKKYRYEP